jgi:hypothetical protein
MSHDGVRTIDGAAAFVTKLINAAGDVMREWPLPPTFEHRIVTGAEAVRFLDALVVNLIDGNQREAK